MLTRQSNYVVSDPNITIDVHWKRLAKLQENEETELYDKEFDMIHGKPLKDYEPPPPLFPLDEDEGSGSDEESNSDESEGEIAASKTRSGKGYQNDDDDDDDPYITQPLSKKAPPWQRSEKHPSKVIDVEEADDAPEEGIRLERWGELPEIQENEGDDQSIDSTGFYISYVQFCEQFIFCELFFRAVASRSNR